MTPTALLPPLSSRSVRIIAASPKGGRLTQRQQATVAGDEASKTINFRPARQQQLFEAARHLRIDLHSVECIVRTNRDDGDFELVRDEFEQIQCAPLLALTARQ